MTKGNRESIVSSKQMHITTAALVVSVSAFILTGICSYVLMRAQMLSRLV